MKQLLIKLNACEEVKIWANNKTWQEFYETCHRGDWLLWLFFKTMNDKSEEDFTLLTHAKGYCANTVRHLMKDERSIAAVDAAMNYCGDKTALKNAAYAAYDAAKAYAAYAAYVAAYAAYVAAYAAAYAAIVAANDAYDAAYDAAIAANAAYDAAYYAAIAAKAACNAAYYAANVATDDAYVAYNAARNRNQLETASIIRRIIPIEKWNIDINL